MAPFFGLIKDLQPGKSKVTPRLGVIRSYKIPQMQNKREHYSQEVVFHDREGTRIHGSVQKISISTFEGLLQEGKIYAVMNYIVARNNKRAKTTACAHVINLYKHTKVVEIPDETFPKYDLNLKSFEEIAKMEETPEDILFDVMDSGKPCELTTSSGKTVKLMEIVIEDLEKRKLKCKMWEDYAEELDYSINSGAEEPVALLLKFRRTSVFRV
ncbi:hypothetical protein OROGR_023431 [Orobanche gracilis]